MVWVCEDEELGSQVGPHTCRAAAVQGRETSPAPSPAEVGGVGAEMNLVGQAREVVRAAMVQYDPEGTIADF